MNVVLHLNHITYKTNSFLYKPIKSPSSLVRMDTTNDNLTLNNLSSNNIIDLPDFSAVRLSFPFQFWFALSFQIPSVICYVFVLTYILTQKIKSGGYSILVFIVHVQLF